MEKCPVEEKDDISKLVSGIVKCSVSRQMSCKVVGAQEVGYYFSLPTVQILYILLNACGYWQRGVKAITCRVL